jgi:hypothetical protein
MIHRYTAACALSIALALLGAPASAGGDNALGGSWELKLSCKGTSAGAPTTRKETIALNIEDGLPGDIRASSGDTGTMLGYVVHDTAKPERTRIVLVGCGVSTLNGVVIQASGKVTPEKGSLKGTAIFLSASSETTEQCTAKLVRTSTTATKVPGCT